ncbi:MAG: 30S ribosomal protein S12 methylthiotransferase RimO [Nocardiopsaceae bacterium]|nr:30S ribosomal protein S12 methylthiotransferase RimO [Nocardiopsaceae bacterium]
MSTSRTVSLVTLGCARNEVDSEELAARLAAGGWTLRSEGASADVVLVNTCGFIQAAKQESIGELLDATDSGAKVVATGCLAERYGTELASELPEVQVLSFDDYADISARLDDVLAGRKKPAHVARDRRALLPLSPVDRQRARADQARTDRADQARGEVGEVTAKAPAAIPRRRLADGVMAPLKVTAPLKIASGCDRRCSFCAIPSFRGAFVSRRPPELLAEAEWLASQGIRELVLVSENSTSYGKDLGDLRLLEAVLPDLGKIDGIEWVRVSYLQPAEVRPGLIDVLASTPCVVPYFDLSFQHASGPVLRSMRRFGDRKRFTALVERIREKAPQAGIRSNFIVGFPGETAADLRELELFLSEARLDAIGIFGYSDEDGTEAAGFGAALKVGADEVARRVTEFAGIAEEVMTQRAADRVGQAVDVLVEEAPDDDVGDGEAGGERSYEGRAAHQAPEVDGSVTLLSDRPLRPGDLVTARVTGSAGADLVARA